MPKAAARHHPKVAIVEDDRELVLLLRRALSSRYVVLVAKDAEEGLPLVRRELPAVVILDILLPGKSGYELLRELKGDPATRDIPVLILSNLGQEQEARTGLSLGAVDYLIKADTTIDAVVARVDELLRATR